MLVTSHHRPRSCFSSSTLSSRLTAARILCWHSHSWLAGANAVRIAPTVPKLYWLMFTGIEPDGAKLPSVLSLLTVFEADDLILIARHALQDPMEVKPPASGQTLVWICWNPQEFAYKTRSALKSPPPRQPRTRHQTLVNCSAVSRHVTPKSLR